MNSKELKISDEKIKKHKLNEDSKEKGPGKKCKLSFLNNLMEHPSSGLRLTLHGNIYQLKLLMLFMIRGLKLNLRYRLATEFDPAEKFDDLFFEYENENEDGSIIRLLQAKHKQDDSTTISLNDLLTETDGEFSLRKYFISYLKILKHAECTRINTEIKDFIICTNIDLYKDLNDNFEPVKGLDVILNMKCYRKEAQLLKFKPDFLIKSKIESIFKNSSESRRLAEKIATTEKLNLTDKLLRAYHGVLAKDVFIVIENTKKIYSTFCDSFLDLSNTNKTKPLILLRDNFLSYVNEKKIDLIKLKSGKILTSEAFGKVFELNDNPKIKNSKEFAQEFVNLVKLAQNNIVQLSRTNKNIKDNINELAGYLLISKEDSENNFYSLSSAFFDDNCSLPVELTIFRSNLKAAFKKEGIVVTKDEFKFKITKFHTCYDGEHNTKVKESLPDDCVTDEEMKGFLNKLVFAVNQPNEVELGKITAKEILAEINVNNDFIVEKFQSYMLNWMKKKEGTFLTFDDGKKFFEEAKSELDKLMFIGLTFDYLAKMDEFCLTFNQNAINNLQMCFNDFFNSESNNQILNILSEHTELCSIKIYQIIKEVVDYKTKDSYIFLCLSTLLRLEDQLLRALGSCATKLLIIATDNTKNDNGTENDNLLNLIQNLKRILVKNSNMKIIIIGSSEKTSLNDAELNMNKYEDINLSLTDLTLESQKKILSEGIVLFQGHSINLNKLLNCKLDNTIDGHILSNLIHKRKLKIGAELFNLGEIEHYYIKRTLKYCVNVDLAFKKKTEFFFIIDGSKYPKSNKENIFFNTDYKNNRLNFRNKKNESNFMKNKEKKKDLNKFDILNKQTTENCIEETMTTNFELKGFNDVEPNDQQDIILISDSRDGYFEELCNKYRRKNIHWLKNVEERLIWKQSFGGNLSKLRDFIDKNIPQFTKPKVTTDLREKLVVIVAEPGMGKSTLLTYLALQTKKSDPTLCILKINLIDKAEKFQSWKKKRTLSETDIKNFLYTCYSEKTNEGPIKALEKFFFDYCYEEGKIIVMFDGFDEISPDYKTVIMKIIKVLQKTTIGGLWITTRPYNIQSDVENVLNTFSYSLQPISKENQISFLKSYCAQNLKVAENNDSFIEQLLGWFSEITNDENGDFVAVPLQLRMIAEVFQNKFEELIKSGTPELSKQYKQMFGEKLNLVILYEMFIDNKFNKILMQEKARLNIAEPIIKTIIEDKQIYFIENHKKLALLSLFGTVGLKMLNIEIGDSVADITEAKEKTGIIDRVIEEKPVFVHKSYAEYFAALWFADNWKENKVKSFLMEYIFKEENNGIRRFFDYLLAYENNRKEIEEESECDYEYADSDNSNDEAGNKSGSEEMSKPLIENKYALHIAALNNDKTKLKQLLEQQNSYEVVNCIDKGGRIALHLMASYDYYEIFDLLKLDGMNFDIDKKDKLFGWSPIIYAEKSGSWHNVESLLQVDANNDKLFKELDNINRIYEGPNNPFTITNMTLLHIATNLGLLNLTKVLIKRGSDVTTPDGFGRSTLHYAACHDGQMIVEILHKHIKEKNPDKLWKFINMKDKDHYNALHMAADVGKTEVVEILLKLVETKLPENFLDFIISETMNGFTALHIVARNGKAEIVKLLLKLVEKKFPKNFLDFINAKQNNGFTALHIAAQRGKTEVVEFLLNLIETKFPENLLEFINAKASDGFTAVFMAAQQGITEIVQFFLNLIETKFPENLLEFINAKASDGFTALHIAAHAGKTEVVELLLKFVETKFSENFLEFINAKMNNGITSLYIAAAKGKTEVIELLIRSVVKIKPDQLWEFMKQKEVNGCTALYISAQNGQTEVFKLLLKLVENKFPEKLFEFVIAKTTNGFTTLLISAQNGITEVVELLLKLVETKFPEKFLDFINAKQNNGFTALHIAAQQGKTEVVELLLNLIETEFPENLLEFINARTNDGFTALYIAAQNGKTEVVELLLILIERKFPEKFLDFINAKQKNGFTAVHIAAQQGKTEVVELLLNLIKTEFPENLLEFINARTNDGFTALYVAAHSGETEVVELLLKLVETTFPENLLELINMKTTNCLTALHIAAYSGKVEVVEILLKLLETKFPEKVLEFINVKANDGYTALHFAAQQGKTKVTELLLNLIETEFPKNLLEFINARTTNCLTALHIAAQSGKIEVVELLLKLVQMKFPEKVLEFMNVKANDGYTALHLAAQQGKTKVTELLLNLIETEFPKNLLEFINARTANCLTALHIAAHSGKTEVVELLLKLVQMKFPENFLDFVNAKQNTGFTAVHIAAQQGKTEVVEVLLKLVQMKFPEKLLEFINVKANDGYNALHLAAQLGKTKVVELLIKSLEKSKPDKLSELINARNLNKRTALHVALSIGNTDIIKILVKYNACVVARDNHNTILHQAVKLNNAEILQSILNEIKRTEPVTDPFINATDSEGDTPLMWAAETGKYEMAKMLLEYGANLDMQNKNGETALHWATMGGYYETVKLLLNKNANSNINDKNGKTPNKLAIEILNKDPKNENINLIKKLLSQL